MIVISLIIEPLLSNVIVPDTPLSSFAPEITLAIFCLSKLDFFAASRIIFALSYPAMAYWFGGSENLLLYLLIKSVPDGVC